MVKVLVQQGGKVDVPLYLLNLFKLVTWKETVLVILKIHIWKGEGCPPLVDLQSNA